MKYSINLDSIKTLSGVTYEWVSTNHFITSDSEANALTIIDNFYNSMSSETQSYIYTIKSITLTDVNNDTFEFKGNSTVTSGATSNLFSFNPTNYNSFFCDYNAIQGDSFESGRLSGVWSGLINDEITYNQYATNSNNKGCFDYILNLSGDSFSLNFISEYTGDTQIKYSVKVF